MKKILLAVALLATVGTASAQWHHGYRCCYRGGYGGGWIAPALIGGVIGYELSRPRTDIIVDQRPIVVEQQPIVVQPQQMVVQQPPAGYHWQQMIDPQTNTMKIVLVPNQ